MSLSFSDFKLVGLTFEVRYPEAYLLWDRAGRIAEELRAKYTITRLAAAEPGKIAFVCNRTREITWQLDRLTVLEYRPASSKLDDFYQLCEECFDITIRNLEITELKRLGFRATFAKNFASKEDAASSLVAAGIVLIPEGKQFNVEALHTFPDYSVRREGEKFGYILKINIQGVKYEFEPPPQWQGNVVDFKEEQRIIFDLDWYTLASMPVGSLRVTDWLSEIVHAIRRDADRYFGS